ncbi:MAG TPA: hypothetical protein VJW51_13975 [Candidatus Acidoferrales bacterium]|nr:hypothetical protein [Candidatus Acidoferrales bacterium]
MRCEEFDRHAVEWMDGERAPEAAEHFQSCNRCSSRMADLALIASAAATLPELDPPATLWTSLHAKLEAENLLRPRKSLGERLREFFPDAPRTALATATISVLAALLLFLPQSPLPQMSREGENFSGARNFAGVNDLLASAEAEASRDVRLRDPEVVASYQQNLALVDNLIGECQRRMNEDPNDEMARQYLVAAYQQKTDLLNALSERDALGE